MKGRVEKIWFLKGKSSGLGEPRPCSPSHSLVAPWVRGTWEPGSFYVKLGGYTKGAGRTLLPLVAKMVSRGDRVQLRPQPPCISGVPNEQQFLGP